MNKLSVLIFLILSIKSFSQDNTLIGKSFITTTAQVNVYGVKDDGTQDSNYFFLVKGTKFEISGITKDKNIKIVMWTFTQKDSQAATNEYSLTGPDLTNYAAKNKSFVGPWANYKQFIITLDDLNSKCAAYFGKNRSFTWGAITLPLKLRFGNGMDRLFQVEENLNLGLVFGLKKQLQSMHEESLNYLIFATYGSVTTDSASLKPDKNGNPTPPPSSGVSKALSTGVGVVFQYQSAFQIGLFLGIDLITEGLGRSWKYQGRPWLGIGLGVALFAPNSSTNNTKNTQTPN